MKIPFFALAFCIAVFSTPALAQGAIPGGHAGHAPASSSDNSAATAYREANDKMHRDMNITFSQDADVDFVRAMIPHHRGAIDMARIALRHGTNEQVKTWAAAIIREQEREISEMQTWLKNRGM